MKLREIIVEAPPQLKAAITDLVQQTDDETLLNRVYTTLKSNDLESRITSVLQKDADAGTMLKSLARVIIHTDGSVEEKMSFADNFANGYVELGNLFSKKTVTFDQFITPGFPQRVFEALLPIIKQGVGPGELALSVLSPKIRFTGQESGGGDLEVAGVGYVELKTEQVAGGRWINARKARLNTMAIKDGIEKASGQEVPGRVNINQWVQIREYLKQNNAKALKPLVKLIADSTFNHVENTAYQNALLTGDAAAIKEAIMQVGFANYKAYSNFNGMLIMSVPKRAARYFTELDEIAGSLKTDTPYILAPESEMMPKARISL